MAARVELTDLFTKEHSTKIESVFRKHFQLGLETTNIDGEEIKSLCSSHHHPAFCRIVRSNTTGRRRCHKERVRGLRIAIDTGQSYISLCHAGIVVICVPVMDKHRALGAMFFGKCLWEPATTILVKDIQKRLKDIRVDKKNLVAAMRKLPVLQGRKIHNAAEFLFDLLYEVGGLDPRVVRWRQQRSEQQSQIGEFLQERH